MPHILTNQYIRLDFLAGNSAETEVELDMGCGKGGFTLQLAEKFPQRLILASDIMLGRLRRLERKAVRKELSNIEVLRTASMELVDWQLPPDSIDRLHLLCPDPWPKARHRNKRLINAEFLARVWNILKPHGVVHFSSDEPNYFQQTKELFSNLTWFEEAPSGIDDIRGLQSDFEKQWRAKGKTVPRLVFRSRKQSCADPASAADQFQLHNSTHNPK